MAQETLYHPLGNDSAVNDSEISEKEPTNVPGVFSAHRWSLCIGVVNIIIFLLWVFIQFGTSPFEQKDPQLAVLANGTWSGRYDKALDQYQFLGVPYALPPVGQLRFRPPHHLNYTWDDIRNATNFGPRCIGYGGKSSWYPNDEDCLTINIIRPGSIPRQHALPVAIFIYGGGARGSGSDDGRYNMTLLVSHATRHTMPFIAVSFNYRASIWGFISSREVLGTKNSNLGLQDQRLALHWVQENIAAFGGDPKKVTLMGGSSGANYVGHHLTAYGGRDDGLFRAAILQSGSAVVPVGLKAFPAQESYDKLVLSTICSDVEHPLECLRHLPLEEFNSAFDTGNPNDVSPNMSAQSLEEIDGELFHAYGSWSLKESRFVKVPIIIGVVSNEGYSWISPHMSSWEDLRHHLLFGALRKYPEAMVERLLSFYPEGAYTEPLIPPIQGFNDLNTYQRVVQLLGDLELNAAKRLQCGAYSKVATCYSYRFDAVERLTGNPYEGARHGSEIGPVFQNFNGLGYEKDRNIFEGRSPAYFEMSKAIGLMWAGFITQLDPNAAFDGQVWPKYNVDHPQNIVFNETGPYWIEEDTARSSATDYIISEQASVLNR
ncbi:putative Carboxylic ester hydrolase [Seiridium unicorne]|uniref:Carboxylic ester hydrolase n=1 Tax=Seiridium unicorne TaxID=138068 RepID=A0ABR2VBZ3_9PEZI